MMVNRYDFLGNTQGFEKTAQGFLRAKANLTRTGIFSYKSDSGIVRELRTDSEVFSAASLASIRGAPVTDLHPSETGGEPFVSPQNAKALAVGFAEDVRQDGDFIAGTLLISDAAVIAAVGAGERKEISLGYSCQVEHTPGEYNGERYDAIQKNIVINHVALGPSGWGRAGPQCAIKFDSNSAIHIKEDAPMAEEKDSAIELLKAELQEKREALEKLTGRFDALSSELENERKRRMDAEDPEVVEGKVQSKMSLLSKCQKFLEGADLEGKTDRELKEAVIAKESPGLDIDGKYEAYLDGVFEAILSMKESRNDALGAAHVAAQSAKIEIKNDAEDARLRWSEQAKNMWQQPLNGVL